MESLPVLAVIIGPTGVGKTAYCLNKATEWQCPIVNCDSRQIYKEIPIGTAAPTEEEQRLVKHYFVGTRSLQEDYSAGMYERDAVILLDGLIKTHYSGNINDLQTPFAILSGGSMLYLSAVLYGLDNLPNIPDYIRQYVKRQYELYGIQWLQNEVAKLDPDYWQEVDKQNNRRLAHCVEITLASGVPYSKQRTKKKAVRPWQTRIIGLTRPREELYERINQRVDEMMSNGLLDEVKRAYLPFKEQRKTLPNSLKTVGYKELIDYIEQRCSLEEAIDKIKQHSRNYAKRQMTWYRNQKDIEWINL